jgi:FkbM family methyltransferase
MDKYQTRADILSIALASVPLIRGKHWLANALARLQIRRGSQWGICSPGNGTILRVNLRDRIQRLMWGHCYENHVQACFRALLSSGETYIDVGAHIGYHAVLAASLVGDEGNVYAFEADRGNFERLRENLRCFRRAMAINKAVWRTTGVIVFERSSEEGESGWGTLTEVRDLKRGEHSSLPAISLDDWSTEGNIKGVSLIKIDAEGSEIGILRGAQKFLQRFKPIIVTEINDVLLRQGDGTSDEITGVLRKHGYELFQLNGKCLQLLGTAGAAQFCEVLCLHVEQRDEAIQRLRARGFSLGGSPKGTVNEQNFG